MEVKFYNQPLDKQLFEILSERLKGNFERVVLCAGFVKDSAIDMILEDVKIARENDTSVELVLGLDKKNTSKDMLSKLLNLGCKIRYHLNTEDAKFETRIFFFDSKNDTSYIYMTGGKFSEGGLTNNNSLIAEMCYSAEEKRDFNMARAAFESGISDTDRFITLDDEKLSELAKSGDIVARITERRIPTINERYNSEGSTGVVSEYNDEADTDKYKELLNKDIDIDISNEDNITVQHGFGDEVEQRLKTEQEEKVISKIVYEQNVDFDNASTIILPLTKANIKDDEIRIPPAIVTSMNRFFEYPESYHVESDEAGNLNEMASITIDFVDNGNGEEKDNIPSKMIMTSKHLALKCECFKEADSCDGDIIRIIKVEGEKYKCEIIRKDTNEFKVWNEFCKTTIKGTSKKFGVM
jgi:hypothetical protein